MFKKISLLIAAVLLVATVGCKSGSKHPSDVAAKILVPTHQFYEGLEKTLLRLYDASKPACSAQPRTAPAVLCSVYDNWNAIDDLNDKISAQVDKVDDAWIAVSQLESPETSAELQTQIDILTSLISQLVALVPSGGIAELQVVADQMAAMQSQLQEKR